MEPRSIRGGALSLNLTENECALPGTTAVTGTCLAPSDKVVHHLRGFLESIPQGRSYTNMSMKHMVLALEEILNVPSEAAIWEHPRFRKFVGEQLADEVLASRYKPSGPAHSTALLDNFNIDNSLKQWSKHSGKLFGKKFYHMPFQMIDFRKTGSELSYIDLGELVRKGYDSFGVVLNTDVSTGRGKHWFCIYGDFAHRGTREDPYQLEYFNSSGNVPMDEVAIWLEETCHNFLKYHGKHCEIVRSVPRRLQNSNTECGMWSLLYIRSRLEGKPANWFYVSRTNDADMIEYRSRIFRSLGKSF
jgi:hypothetical protein